MTLMLTHSALDDTGGGYSAAVAGAVTPVSFSASLSEVIGGHVQRYLCNLGGALENCDDLYGRFLAEMERPLLQQVLTAAENNQVKAAKMLGINRNTLRKKMTMLGIAIV